ncbi:MAG: hypothetical protein ACRD6R_04715 [Candidatus Polarisedimenticolia bacterium]
MADAFWVIGADGREYGPADGSMLRRWVAERRIVAGSRIRLESGEPVEARSLPEIADLFEDPGSAAAAGGPASNGAPIAEFRVWDLLSRAWDLVRPHWFILGAMFFILCAIGSVPYIGWIAQFVVTGAVMIGIWRAVLGMLAGRPPSVGMMFESFDRLLDGFLATLVMGVLIGVGFLFFVVPGVILMILWTFTYPILAERPVDFWEAMRLSARLTEGYRWRLFLLGLASCLILFLGMLVFFVGVFVAWGVVVTAYALAYRHLMARQGSLIDPPAVPPR